MPFVRQRITVISIRKPASISLNEELQYFGQSLGLFGERDRDRSAFRIFIELLKAAKRGQALSSDELAELSGLSRGTVVHHLNRLMEQGLIVTARKRYHLRESNLEVLIDDLRKDFDASVAELMKAAEEIDKGLGI